MNQKQHNQQKINKKYISLLPTNTNKNKLKNSTANISKTENLSEH